MSYMGTECLMQVQDVLYRYGMSHPGTKCLVQLHNVLFRCRMSNTGTDRPMQVQNVLCRYRMSYPGTECLIIIMVIFKCYFSVEHIALSFFVNNNDVNMELGKINRLKALCMV